jgi:hypothetical protein
MKPAMLITAAANRGVTVFHNKKFRSHKGNEDGVDQL